MPTAQPTSKTPSKRPAPSSAASKPAPAPDLSGGKARLTDALVARTQDALAGGGRVEIWDADVRGLAVRVSRKAATYRFRYRLGGKRYSLKLGAHCSAFKVREARVAATRARSTVDEGRHPVAEQRAARAQAIVDAAAPTVADLCARYLEEHARPHKAPRSVRSDELNIRNHVLPAWGGLRVDEVTREHALRLHAAISKPKRTRDGKRALGGPGVANRVLALVSKMLHCAEDWGWRPAGSNPALRLPKNRERKLNRYLSDAEYARLDDALETIENDPTTRAVRRMAVPVVRVLIGTGCRASEVLERRWPDVDLEQGLMRVEGKTGERYVPLNAGVVEVLRSLRAATSSVHGPVFPDPRHPARSLSYSQYEWMWRTIREIAGLPGLRTHDLRHSFASLGAREGLSLLKIGRLLGHKTPSTTNRYAHLTANELREDAAALGEALQRRIAGDGKVRHIRR